MTNTKWRGWSLVPICLTPRPCSLCSPYCPGSSQNRGMCTNAHACSTCACHGTWSNGQRASHITGCAMPPRSGESSVYCAAARLLRQDGGEKEGKRNRRKDEGIRKKKDWGDKTQRQEKKKKVEPKKKKERKQVKCITQLSDSNNKCSHFSWNIALKQSTPYSSKQQSPFPHYLPTSGSPEDDLFPTYLTYI